jgi:hypothetical protein
MATPIYPPYERWEPRPPDPERSTLEQRKQWMIRFSRFHTRELAMADLLENPPDRRMQVAQLDEVMMHGFAGGATLDEIRTTANAEWDLAVAHCMTLLDRLRRELWPLCRTNMPRPMIIARAEQLFIDANVGITDELLMPLLRDIWLGARGGR